MTPPRVIDSQGRLKITPALPVGAIVPFYDTDGLGLPTDWALCDGTLGTPDLRGYFIIGGAAGSASAAGTTAATAALTHTGATADPHADHVVQPLANHGDHTVTPLANHADHTVTQPATHADHALFDSDGDHVHNAHTTEGRTTAGLAAEMVNPAGSHEGGGAHQHDAHSAHSAATVTAHDAHGVVTVDAHSAHSLMTATAHSAHSVTQASAHAVVKTFLLAFVKRIR